MGLKGSGGTSMGQNPMSKSLGPENKLNQSLNTDLMNESGKFGDDFIKRESKSLDGRYANEFSDSSAFENNFGLERAARVSIIKGGTRPRTTLRTDRAGTVISRHTKNYKISFADSV